MKPTLGRRPGKKLGAEGLKGFQCFGWLFLAPSRGFMMRALEEITVVSFTMERSANMCLLSDSAGQPFAWLLSVIMRQADPRGPLGKSAAIKPRDRN